MGNSRLRLAFRRFCGLLSAADGGDAVPLQWRRATARSADTIFGPPPSDAPNAVQFLPRRKHEATAENHLQHAYWAVVAAVRGDGRDVGAGESSSRGSINIHKKPADRVRTRTGRLVGNLH